MELKFKKLTENATLPSYAHDTDAGLDLTTIGFTQEFDASGKMIIVYRTGLAVEIPEGHVGFLFMRSSVSGKSVSLTNAVGVIDSGYRGEIMGKFKITTDALPSIYKEGDKFAQLIVMPYPKFEVVEATELTESERGENGYGSTDKVAEPIETEATAVANEAANNVE